MTFSTENSYESELAPLLGASETLLWSGKPRQGIVFRRSDIFMIPFSLLWCGFVVFWEVTAVGQGAPAFFALFGIPFVLMGLYLTIGRFFLDSLKRKRTIYGITKERILIKSGYFNPEIKSLNIRSLSDITLNQKADGSGTIQLGPAPYRYYMMDGMDWPGIKKPPCLELIVDAKDVYDLIIRNQREV